MKSFDFLVSGSGLHARQAGLLVMLINRYAGHSVTISRGDQCINAAKPVPLMSMGITEGDVVTVTVNGEEEAALAADIEAFFDENLSSGAIIPDQQ